GNAFIDASLCLLSLYLASLFMAGFPKKLQWSSKALREIFQYSRIITFIGLIQKGVGQWEKALLGRFIGASAMPYYSIPHSLISRLSMISGALAGSLLPELSGMHACGKEDKGQALILRVIGYLWLLLFPLILFLGLIAYDLFSIWIGSEFAEKGSWIARILLLGGAIYPLGHLLSVVPQAWGKPHLLSRVYLISAIFYLPLAPWIVAKWGIEGAGWAWTLRSGLEGLLLLWTAKKVLSTPWKELLSAFMRRGSPGILLWSITCGVLDYILPRSLDILIRVILTTCIYWAGVGWIVYKQGIDESEKTAIKTFIGRYIAPVKNIWR
ncbi:MAG: oligosaccharide flippase family protein, partial [Bacteroidia bacterium]|nr:oligosaccharide flippase family protein [Bacteroidia bacterium]